MHGDRAIPPALDQPDRQADEQEQAGDRAEDHPRLEEKVIHRPGDVVKFLREENVHRPHA